MDASPQRLNIPKEVEDIEEVSDTEPPKEIDQEKAQEEKVLKAERNSVKELSEMVISISISSNRNRNTRLIYFENTS